VRVGIDLSTLNQSDWREIVIRFVGGGLITAAMGVIAREWGPIVEGLFLAFPSIFPAASSLVEKHAKDKRSHARVDGVSRARHIAALDAAGATIGSVGLLAFAIVAWQLLPRLNAMAVLAMATAAWFAVAALIWWTRKYM